MNQVNDAKANLNIGEALIKEKEYWSDKLAGEPSRGYFPYDYQVKDIDVNTTSIVTYAITGGTFSRLMQLRNDSDPRLHMIMVAVINILIFRYSGGRDIIVGTTIDKQERDTGYINTILPLRNQIEDHMTFKQFLLQVRSAIAGAVENQNYPVEELYDQLAANTGKNISTLFEVTILLENIQDRKYLRHIQPAVLFSFNRTVEYIDLIVEYQVSLYKKDTIEKILEHFNRLLEIVIFDVDIELFSIDLLSPGERQELIVEFNNTMNDYPEKKTVYELFEEQAAKTPAAPALIFEDMQVSYRELSEKSNRLAQWLNKNGLEPKNVVGIMMERSIEMVIGILGIFKSGGAYLPIDPAYPGERINYMLNDSGAKMLATTSIFAKEFEKLINRKDKGNIGTIILDRSEFFNLSPSEPLSFLPSNSSKLAYVIYTSGSTGKPKGVAVEHRALVNYIWWAAKMYVKNEKINFPLYTSIGFDMTNTSLFTPLITGNTIYIYEGEGKDFLLDRILDENKVEAVKLTPVHLMVTGDNIREKNLSKIKRFIVGGEKLETQLAHKIYENFKENIEIYNEYGPTEAAIGCMIYKYNPRKGQGVSVPIGSPADNVRIYLLDAFMKNVPVGGIGELYIAGDGLARGYLNNPGLTHERFIPNPIEPGKKIYKTGDTARRLVGGDIEFLGRMDQQFKIRGYRIETREIENYLSKHGNISQAVVVAKEDEKGYKYLAAYVVLDRGGVETDIGPEELRGYLSKYLPEFMIPSFFLKLEEMPVTANGKIDRKSLPAPDKSALETGAEYQPPTTELEKILVEIWQDVMGVERVGINDNYFALGGDSIKAIQISARLHNVNWNLELKDLFQYSTIKDLAYNIKPVKEIADQEIVEGEVMLTPIQKWFFESNFTDEHHFNLSVMLRRSEGFEEEIVKKVFDKLVEHHDALRIVFKREGGKIVQINRGDPDDFVDIRVFDVRGENDYKKVIEEKCDDIQGSIDLNGNPLVKVGLFKSGNDDYLLIVIHHLIMDTVSWRILFEDFTSLYRQIENGVEKEKLEIPLKSTSYKEWAGKLYEYSGSESLIEELDYWRKVENAKPFAHSKNKGGRIGKNKDSKGMAFELSGEYTEKLLKQVNAAYNTEINDILLAALGLAVSDWIGAEKVPLILEGHGREEIIPGVNITRTVGWFTSMYPVVLNMKNRDSEASVIKDTKELLRTIPFKGVGYGVLRYLTGEENTQGITFGLNPEISFNYLGQFDEDVNGDFFRISDISAGDPVSLNMERIYPLYISGTVFDGRLRISVNYDAGNYEKNEIRFFLDGYENRLRQIIDHCIAREETELTLSDYSLPVTEKDEANLVFEALGNIKLDD